MIKEFPLCTRCNTSKPRSNFSKNIRKRGWGPNQIGKGHLMHPICDDCNQGILIEVGNGYRINKKDYCERCGFKGLPCQLDVNHKDGNHKNDELNNLETLCANCHRFETFIVQRKINY